MFFLFSQPRVLRKVCHNKHCRLHHGHTRDHTLAVSAPAGSRGIKSRAVLRDAVVESRHASSDGCYTWRDDARDARHRHHEHDRHLYQGFLHHRPGTGIKGVRTNAPNSSPKDGTVFAEPARYLGSIQLTPESRSRISGNHVGGSISGVAMRR